VCGRPVLWHVLAAIGGVKPQRLIVVVGREREQVEEAIRGWGIKPDPVFVEQEEPLGTGHAVMVAEDAVGDAGDVLVMAGDDPLVATDHIRRLLRVHRRTKAAASILTTEVEDPKNYWRVRREGERVEDVVEKPTLELRDSREIATLVYAVRREDLYKALPLLDRENRQREYYLPDVLKILQEKGERISGVLADLGGGLGVNTRSELARTARVMRERINDAHMANGVTLVDPAQTYVDVGVRIGPDTVVHPQTYIEGETRIGRDCVVGPATRIVDSSVADGAQVQFSVVRGSRIGKGANVGPYASLRPGTVLEEGSKAGTFVEIKASRVGKRSKVPHLSYVGDADIGRDVNIGAATVTVNYDGWEKHRTVIGDEAKVGSDTMLVAPVKVGKGAMTGAGSVITKDVPAGALGIERSEQRNIAGYRKGRKSRASRKKPSG
jgi:bifunctional UDP-N-acetylglucosamine pyrophosphorylase/glucosamine-1-phosphate N-acetyltransferase